MPREFAAWSLIEGTDARGSDLASLAPCRQRSMISVTRGASVISRATQEVSSATPSATLGTPSWYPMSTGIRCGHSWSEFRIVDYMSEPLGSTVRGLQILELEACDIVAIR